MIVQGIIGLCFTIVLASHHNHSGHHHQSKHGMSDVKTRHAHTPAPPVKHSQESETVIENKNVNIVVNVDPKDVAAELWKIIEKHLERPPSRRSLETYYTKKQLERVLTPNRETSAVKIAEELDLVTRRALNNNANTNTIDNEIKTREIVSQMMKKLKDISKNDGVVVDDDDDSGDVDDDSEDTSVEERMQAIDDDDDEYVILNLRLRKTTLLDALQ